MTTTLPAIRKRRLCVNHIELYVAEAGPQDAESLLVFLHGFPESWHSWRHQLTAFSDSHLCVAPDLRGYGQSDKPARGYDLDTLALDVLDLIGHYGQPQVTLVAHDWGGAIAWHLARQHPGAIDRLVVLNCPPVETLAYHILTSARQLRRSSYMFYFQLPHLPEQRLTANGAIMIEKAFYAGARRRDRFTSEDMEHYKSNALEPHVVSTMLAYYRTAMRHLLNPLQLWRLARVAKTPIEVPTLVLWGREDPFLGIDMTRNLDRVCRGPLTVRYIEDCGHWTQQEAPEEVNGALNHFLSQT